MFSIEPGLTHRWAKRPQVILREPLEIGTPESDVVDGELSIVLMWQKVIAAQSPPTPKSDRSTTHPPSDHGLSLTHLSSSLS
jgi:hypothetical protein